MLKAVVLFASLAFAGAAAAQQYKWTDQSGRVQYGDTPPAGADVSSVRRAPPPPASEADATSDEAQKAPARYADKEAEFRKRRQDAEKEREKQAQARQEADEKRENCARAKENVRTLETGRVARMDANGERHFLTDAQIAHESAKARQAVQEWCN
jgi:flagellar motility protein MotE (MotC chaperone)